MFFACIVLAVWNVPDALKFVAFYSGGLSGMASPILVRFLFSFPPTPSDQQVLRDSLF